MLVHFLFGSLHYLHISFCIPNAIGTFLSQVLLLLMCFLSNSQHCSHIYIPTLGFVLAFLFQLFTLLVHIPSQLLVMHTCFFPDSQAFFICFLHYYCCIFLYTCLSSWFRLSISFLAFNFAHQSITCIFTPLFQFVQV